MSNSDKAKQIFEEGGYTCVLCKGETIYTSTLKGVAPMVGFISDNIMLKGFSAADKIVGKAAAMLFSVAGVSEVYGEVMSEEAIAFFKEHGIAFQFSTVTAHIINRKGTGACPMEEAVQNIDDPHKGFEAIRNKMKQLSKN